MAENLFAQEPWARRGEAAPANTTPIGMSYLPVGVPVPWPSTTAPTGWLICNGQATPAGCPTLLALYGANLPDLRGKIIVGYDVSQAEFDTIGETGGAKTVTLTQATMPAHGHVQDPHGHTSDDNDTGSHQHDTPNQYLITAGFDSTWNLVSNAAANIVQDVTGADLTDSAGSHNHNITVGNSTATNQATGGGGAHENMPPYKVFNYIVQAA